MKKSFEKVSDKVYYLRTSYADHEAGITLILGATREDTVLIDTGAGDKAIYEELFPALRGINLSPKNIGYVTLTHCHTDNIGGLHALKKEVPDIKIAVPTGFADIIRNPMYYIIKEREIFPDHNPIFEEIRGAYPTVCGDNISPGGLKPIPAPGHDDNCVCWFHAPSGTLICGDALQGNGNAHQGMPYYKNIAKYRHTLETLKDIPVRRLISSHSMDGISAIEYGIEKFKAALTRCEECVTDTGHAIYELTKKGVKSVPDIALTLSEKNFGKAPPALCYAMHTVSAHLTEKVLRDKSQAVKKAPASKPILPI